MEKPLFSQDYTEVHVNELAEFKIVNLTPHDVNIIHNNFIYVFKRSGLIARCNIAMGNLTFLGEIPVFEKNINNIESPLPQQIPGVLYLVSSLVMDNNPEREDLIAPNTSQGQVIKNAVGQVYATKSLQKLKRGKT